MLRRILRALSVPAILFGITFLVMAAGNDGPWSAGANVSSKRSHKKAYAQVYGGFGKLTASYNIHASASNSPKSDSGSYTGSAYKSVKDRSAFSTIQPTASADINGHDNHGVYHSDSDSAP